MHVPGDENELRVAINQIVAAIAAQREIIQQRRALNAPTLIAHLECRELELTLSEHMRAYYARLGAGLDDDETRDAAGTEARE